MEDLKPYLHATRMKLLQEISALTDDEFNGMAGSGKWSIAQVCHHLLKTEKLFLKALSFGVEHGDRLQPARKPIQSVSDRSEKFPAPKVSEPDAGPFQVAQIVQQLNDSRSNFIGFLDSIEPKSMLKEIAVNHPRFGDLPLDQWVELLYLHEQRHIEQIKDLKSSS
ncbi:DinB family protein [Paenibacillus humicus]|uniref:DinB family protein n=1 Tax=Paenibacillus humicus TaxID=412861 RepID=UPI000FD845CD|nr:DinB family protein [Paenibacillus humicus]